MKIHGKDDLSISSLRRRALLDPVLMRQLRRTLMEGSLIPAGSMNDTQLLDALEHWTEAGRIDPYLFSELMPSSTAPTLSGPVAVSSQETVPESDETVESEPEEEYVQEAYELEFVLESEETGHVLPFHPYKVLDDAGQEIASGETDEEGRVLIDVDREAEYEVVVGTEKTHNIAGQVLERGSLMPVQDVTIEIAADEGDTYTATSGTDGRFQVRDVVAGYLVLRIGAVERPIFLDGELKDLQLFIANASVEEQPLDEGDEENYLYANEWVSLEIQPEDY